MKNQPRHVMSWKPLTAGSHRLVSVQQMHLVRCADAAKVAADTQAPRGRIKLDEAA